MKIILIIILMTVIRYSLFPNDSLLCTNPEVVFCSGFEEGNKDIWDDFDPNPDSTNLILLHPGPFNDPYNHVMRFRVPQGRGAADLVKVLPSSYDKLYVRWYQMWEEGYDFTARNHGSGLHAGSRNYLGVSGRRPQGNDWFGSWIEPADGRLNLYTYYRGMYMDCADPNGQCWGDHFPCWFDEGEHICTKEERREKTMPPLLVAGKWYCLEVMVDAGTPVQSDSEADGRLNFWIDGVEYGPWEHLWFRTSANVKLDILWFDLFHHAEHSVEGIMLDDIVVSREYVGCQQVNNTGSRNPESDLNLRISQNPGYLNIYYSTSKHGSVSINILDILGSEVATPVNEYKLPGEYDVQWNTGNLPFGVYYLMLKTEAGSETQKVLLIK